MTTGLELIAMDDWIVSTLSSASDVTDIVGTRIFSEQMPKDVKFPYVIFNTMATNDALTQDQVTVLVMADYQIKGVDRASSYNTLAPLSAAIYAALHRQGGTVTDGYIHRCSRQRTIKYPEVRENVHYRHLGGMYRLWVEGAS